MYPYAFLWKGKGVVGNKVVIRGGRRIWMWVCYQEGEEDDGDVCGRAMW